MLYREITQYLINYYRTSNNALMLTGARQTGKTYSARQLGKSFKSFIEINFIESPSACNIFRNISDTDDILLRLSAFTTLPLIKGDTLIFFDEVQACPEVVTQIKFLVDQGDYRYILSGSLLGVELHDLRSQPVGYLGIKEMFPLTLKEFSINLGVSEHIIESLEQCFLNYSQVDTVVHQKMMEIVRLYTVVGGMPAAVNAYLSDNNLQTVIQTQSDIINLYRRDIAQYAAQSEKVKIKEIFDLIPSELDAKNKRFIIKALNQHAKFIRYQDSFLWLKDAGVAIPVFNVENPIAPLKLSETRNLFKLFSNDIGLLCAQYGDGIQLRLLTGDEMINFGAIFENLVAQEFTANTITPYYYNNKRRGEVDFLIFLNGAVLPIEVKSGKSYSRHSALTNLLADYSSIPKAIVLCTDNVSANGQIIYLPVYMTMFIRPVQIPPLQFKLDLSALK
ncbi:MAG: ATP-binding protein [Muribaculaceae bacterium]|nr:ATP-binding protein [Muribaculaceae bacterium]